MGKATTAKKLRQQGQKRNEAKVPSGSIQGQLSRGQRKRLAKREQYMQKEKLILSSLRVKQSEEQKGRIDGMDAIRKALDEAAQDRLSKMEKSTTTKPTERVKSHKSRKLVMIKEVTQIGLVLQHPAFQNDPIQAIRQHLLNTIDTSQKRHDMELRSKHHVEKSQEPRRKHSKKPKKFKATRSKTK